MDMAPRKAFGGTVGVSSNFCSSLDSNQGRTAARSKALNHYPVVAAYGWQVQCAGSSTGLPPSIKVAERGALSGLLVSEMLKRSVEEEDCTQWRSGCLDSDTVCDL